MEDGTATKLLYLQDQNQLEASATIVDVYTDASEIVITSDQTPLYVKKGGQPSDAGVICGDGFTVTLSDVSFDAVGRVLHRGTLSGRTPSPGEAINIVADKARRQLHSRWHSAGEALIVAAKMAGYDRPITSAIHYGPNQNRIEYEGKLVKEGIESLKVKINERLDQLIADDIPITLLDLTDPQAIVDRCGFIPDYIPAGQSVRVVQVHPDYTGRPCSGTHVASTGELKGARLEKIKCKGEKTIFSYGCD